MIATDTDTFRVEGYYFQPAVFAGETLAELRAQLDGLAGTTPGPPRVVEASAPWLTAETGHFFVPVPDLATRAPAWRVGYMATT